MNNSSALMGWYWVKKGFKLFLRRPFFLTNLFFLYTVSIVLLGLIPFVGQILPMLIAPIFTFLFMNVCRSLDRYSERITIKEVFSVLKGSIFFRLLLLGAFQLSFLILAALISLIVDSGTLLNVILKGNIQDFTFSGSRIYITCIIIICAYIPWAMAMWFSAPLIGWQNMSLPKALFYSFFTVAKNLKPFIVYVIIWIGIGLFIPIVVGTTLIMFIGSDIGILILFIISIILSVCMFCSFYPTYKEFFEKGDPINIDQSNQQIP